MKNTAIFLMGLVLSIGVSADPTSHGHIRINQNQPQAWDQDAQQWISPDVFWQRYAEQKGGLTWGTDKDYPPYERVKEGDTFLVVLASGPCLMEFFHQRWRRANDVRRWDEKFNEYGGCPNVFDK